MSASGSFRQYIFVVLEHLVDYPTPFNISYLWSFGSLAGMVLVIQIVTGIFLAMHYVANVDLAFASVEHIMRDVNFGWMLRYSHANGASFFFIVVYLHIGRGLYFNSYMTPREMLWISGIILFFLMMATAFIGYVLPWGQMSLWGATVITNLVSAIPVVGDSIVYWLWGGFSVNNATLNRFFSFHYVLPFVLVVVVCVHLVFLHKYGSHNPLGVELYQDYTKVSFYPYFYVKDLVGFIGFLFCMSVFVFFWPNLMGHPDNYIEANAMVTPPHIVPEWYFLPFYAILRSIPDKLGGVIAMCLSIFILAVLPFVTNSVRFYIRSSFFKVFFKGLFWILVAVTFILGWVGQNPAEPPYIVIGQISTVYYFWYFAFGVWGFALLESCLLKLANKS